MESLSFYLLLILSAAIRKYAIKQKKKKPKPLPFILTYRVRETYAPCWLLPMDKSRGFQRLVGPHEPYSRRSKWIGLSLFYFRSIPIVRWAFLARDAMPLSAKGSQLNLYYICSIPFSRTSSQLLLTDKLLLQRPFKGLQDYVLYPHGWSERLYDAFLVVSSKLKLVK